MIDTTTVHKCVLCLDPIKHQKTLAGEIFWTTGHNAQPVAEGRCCSECNSNVVIPRRLSEALMLTNWGIE